MILVPVPARKAYFSTVTSLFLMMLLLAACGGNKSTPSNTTTSSSTSSPASSANAATAATATTIKKLVSLVGQPDVKMLSGTTFEADGQLKNNDTYQHDFTLRVTLLDSSGKVIATATRLVDNVKGGVTINYAIQGTTTQPNWASVEVAVINVSENINGSGGD